MLSGFPSDVLRLLCLSSVIHGGSWQQHAGYLQIRSAAEQHRAMLVFCPTIRGGLASGRWRSTTGMDTRTRAEQTGSVTGLNSTTFMTEVSITAWAAVPWFSSLQSNINVFTNHVEILLANTSKSRALICSFLTQSFVKPQTKVQSSDVTSSREKDSLFDSNPKIKLCSPWDTNKYNHVTMTLVVWDCLNK